MNISVKSFYKILTSYIKYYYYLFSLNKIGIKKFMQDLKQGKGLAGILLRTILTLILKFVLFFILLGGFSSGIEFNNFLDHCSLLFFFDFNTISNIELYKIQLSPIISVKFGNSSLPCLSHFSGDILL